MGNLKLVELKAQHEPAFWEFFEALKAAGDCGHWLFEYQGESYPDLVCKLKSWKIGQKLPPNWVPASQLFLMRDEKIIGRVSLRHELNDFLRRIGGHIGYYIRTDERNKGYGSEILRLALAESGKLGLKRVLVTCDEDHIASKKIIEKNGGVLENIQPTEDGPPKRRYWIELEKEAK